MLHCKQCAYAELATVEDLFNYVERRLEGSITPMDKVRIVRHSQRICLRDILENVYDNFTEVGGQDEHSLDPSDAIARAVAARRRGKKVYTQSVMVIGQEKGHGAEFRNGGSVKPWGNAKAQQYMRVLLIYFILKAEMLTLQKHGCQEIKEKYHCTQVQLLVNMLV